MKITKTLLLLVWIFIFCALPGCGSGGGGNSSTTSTKAVMKLSIAAGAVASQTVITGVTVKLTLPPGVKVSAVNDVIVPSGVANGGTVRTGIYTPATATTKATLEIFISKISGFDANSGEFATVTFDLDPGISQQHDDFKILTKPMIYTLPNEEEIELNISDITWTLS